MGDAGMVGEDVLDLEGVDVVAAAHVHLLGAPRQVQPAPLVD